MKFPTAFLWINTALFAAFGVGFVIAAAPLSKLITDSVPATSSALIDMRATYGGISLGLAIFFGMCARDPKLTRVGLWAALFVMSGIVAGRLTGLAIDGSPNMIMLVALIAEVLFVGLSWLALSQEKNHEHAN